MKQINVNGKEVLMCGLDNTNKINNMKRIAASIGLIVIACVILMAYGNKPPTRYFLVGYVGTTYQNQTFVGGFDTNMIKYPNVYNLQKFFNERFNLKNCKIVGVTEYSNSDRKEFWRQ